MIKLLIKRSVATMIDLSIIFITTVFTCVLLDLPAIVFCIVSGVLMLCKDLNNISIGKRIFNLKIVHCSDEKIKWYNMILRNITIPILTLELLAAYINNGIRLGDSWAKTRVVEKKTGDGSLS